MNWKEFKNHVESAGVLDDDDIDYMDFSYPVSTENDPDPYVVIEGSERRHFHVWN